MAELTKGITCYRRLGLDFEKVQDDKLRLTFSALDAAAPDATATLSVRVSAGDKYEVDGVSPPVEGLAGLVAELNAGNDFSLFVQRMRKAFVAAIRMGAHR